MFEWRPFRVQACSIAPVIRPVISCGEVAAIRLSATLVAAPQHDDAVGDREDVGHAVADQDDGEPLPPQFADEIENLRHLADGDRRGRLVHQHDFGVGKAGAGDRDRLALAARHRRARGRAAAFPTSGR